MRWQLSNLGKSRSRLGPLGKPKHALIAQGQLQAMSLPSATQLEPKFTG